MADICATCQLVFTGTADFDSHRVGTHAYTYSEGVAMSPLHEDGRRCLSLEEIEQDGCVRNSHGCWSHPRRARPSAAVRVLPRPQVSPVRAPKAA